MLDREKARQRYEAPAVEDLGEIHEVTQQAKVPAPSDSPFGNTGQQSGTVGP